ncbi:MAG: RNA methyltransferase [Burkholderiales bacterium]
MSSPANPLIKQLRQLARDPGGYRAAGSIWIEGEHLCGAAVARGWRPELTVFSESFWASPLVHWTDPATKKIVIVSDRLFAAISPLDSPAGIGMLLPLAEPPALLPTVPTVILDRLQDAGNVGSILRSAAAFGFAQIVALKGTAALWAPKVLRAGMGAHFGLRLIEQAQPADLELLDLPILQTSSHDGAWLHEADLPSPAAWVFGHEGQGIDPALAVRFAARTRQGARSIRIAQPGGEESLNVAAAAAICLHAGAVAASSAKPVAALRD